MRPEVFPPGQPEQPGDEPDSQPEKQPDPKTQPDITKKKEILPDPDDAWIIPAWIDPHKEGRLPSPLEDWDE